MVDDDGDGVGRACSIQRLCAVELLSHVGLVVVAAGGGGALVVTLRTPVGVGVTDNGWIGCGCVVELYVGVAGVVLVVVGYYVRCTAAVVIDEVVVIVVRVGGCGAVLVVTTLAALVAVDNAVAGDAVVGRVVADTEVPSACTVALTAVVVGLLGKAFVVVAVGERWSVLDPAVRMTAVEVVVVVAGESGCHLEPAVRVTAAAVVVVVGSSRLDVAGLVDGRGVDNDTVVDDDGMVVMVVVDLVDVGSRDPPVNHYLS